ncbi:MAG: hypothetical protein EAZ36_01550 [Verrucomicrobia bacterium]|nr:MAG: hypothetical protein EAZ36_01550 [Verrucomicrobiota bacterium]
MNTFFHLPIARRLAWCGFFFAAAPAPLAHNHIDVRPDVLVPERLSLVGVDLETMLYVPRGEPFSLYAPSYPGGFYTCELTFTHEDPDGSTPSIQLLSVAGPMGAVFAFWEVGAQAPTWSRPVGWMATATDHPALHTDDQGGFGHIHGRVFTVTQAGSYSVVFRVVDEAEVFQPSLPKTVVFQALATPQLLIHLDAGNLKLSFLSRQEFTYDLQASHDLVRWENVPAHRWIEGTGTALELSDPLAGRARIFYRLVEYF